jgi:hypothetical protein
MAKKKHKNIMLAALAIIIVAVIVTLGTKSDLLKGDITITGHGPVTMANGWEVACGARSVLQVKLDSSGNAVTGEAGIDSIWCYYPDIPITNSGGNPVFIKYPDGQDPDGTIFNHQPRNINFSYPLPLPPRGVKIITTSTIASGNTDSLNGQYFQFKVGPGGSVLSPKIVLIQQLKGTDNFMSFIKGVAIPSNMNFGHTGGVEPYTYSHSSLPPGIQFDDQTGIFSGTPTSFGFGISITVTDRYGHNENLFTTIRLIDPITAVPTMNNLPVPKRFSPASGQEEYVFEMPQNENIARTIRFTSSGGIFPRVGGALGIRPNGLNIPNLSNSTLMEGIPTSFGVYHFGVKIHNSDTNYGGRGGAIIPIKVIVKPSSHNGPSILDDGDIDAEDVVELLTHIGGGQQMHTFVADVDESGTVDLTDVIELIKSMILLANP